MRQGIKMLCVTNWGAVLDLKTRPYYWENEYNNNGYVVGRRTVLSELLTVADPDAVDAGMVIRLDEIKLVARIKRK